jgi:hypothetical protein
MEKLWKSEENRWKAEENKRRKMVNSGPVDEGHKRALLIAAAILVARLGTKTQGTDGTRPVAPRPTNKSGAPHVQASARTQRMSRDKP